MRVPFPKPMTFYLSKHFQTVYEVLDEMSAFSFGIKMDFNPKLFDQMKCRFGFHHHSVECRPLAGVNVYLKVVNNLLK